MYLKHSLSSQGRPPGHLGYAPSAAERGRYLFRLVVFVALLLGGCRPAVELEPGTPTGLAQAAPTQVTATLTAIPVEAQPTPVTPALLRLWVPPEFSPASGTPAGNLLQARLNEYIKNRPSVGRIEVRVKALHGPGGLLDALSTAGAAAPAALPDVVALPRDLLEQAALKGLLQPSPVLAQRIHDGDWYPYAIDLARLQGTVYGLPFAGDALALAYRTQEYPQPPVTWQDVQAVRDPLAFAAADPLALFTLATYQAAGGQITTEPGKSALDTVVLTEVLTYYAVSEQAGVMPSWLTQIQADEQAWDALNEGRTDLAVTWASRYLAQGADELALAPLPTPDGRPFTLATGWVWALAARDGERQAQAAELASFLAEPAFLESWWQAAGLLPVQSSGLSRQDDPSELQQVLHQIASSARLLPPAEAQPSLGGLLEAAVVQVLKRQATPLDAAQAATQLTGP